MKAIQLQIGVTLEGETLATLAGFLNDIFREATGIDEKKEARLRASQNALFGSQKPPEDKGLLIDTKQAAKLLKCGERTIWSLSHSGRMPSPLKIGGAVRWPYEELKAWVDAGCPPQDEWRRRRLANRPGP